jgi:hypothetical protein
MKAIQMMDVHIPTTDGRALKMRRYTKPDQTQQLLLTQLKLRLPAQTLPQITASVLNACSEDLSETSSVFRGIFNSRDKKVVE